MSSKAVLIKIYPGFSPEILDKFKDFQCVILEALGPGNVPFLDNSLIEKIEELTAKKVTVLISTQNPFGEVDMSLYEVGKKATKAGAISCKDMTSETSVVKAMWLLGNFGQKEIKKMMVKNFVGEIK